MDHPALLIVMRLLHIVGAILLVGGTAFILTCAVPALRTIDDTWRDTVLTLLRKRFARWVWIGIAMLLISGTYNWIASAGEYKAMGPIGNALIGTKVLIAIILFALIWAQQTGLVRHRSPRAALMINIHLGAVVIILAVVLRHFRLEHLATGG